MNVVFPPGEYVMLVLQVDAGAWLFIFSLIVCFHASFDIVSMEVGLWMSVCIRMVWLL